MTAFQSQNFTYVTLKEAAIIKVVQFSPLLIWTFTHDAPTSSVYGSKQTCTNFGFTVLWIGTPGFRPPCLSRSRNFLFRLPEMTSLHLVIVKCIAVLGPRLMCHGDACRSYSPRLAAKKHTHRCWNASASWRRLWHEAPAFMCQSLADLAHSACAHRWLLRRSNGNPPLMEEVNTHCTDSKGDAFTERCPLRETEFLVNSSDGNFI